jgi:hypothetical protein
MKRVPVDVVVENEVVPIAEVHGVVRALQKQIDRDFSPVWDVGARLRVVRSRRDLHPGAWQLVLVDGTGGDEDGYHELTREGMPLGRVYLQTARSDATGWSTTASHELLEMLANPEGQRAVCVYDRSVGYRTYAHEVCDPCQDDAQCYRIGGVWVSDFIYPAWFETWRAPRSARFDHARKLSSPMQIAPGGYASYVDARKDRWVDDYGRSRRAHGLAPMLGFARGGSRRKLREIPRPQWRKSDG